MFDGQTKAKLRKMKMGTVIEAAKTLEGSAEGIGMSRDEWLAFLVDRLYEQKLSDKIASRVKAATLAFPGAYLEDLCRDPDRGLDVKLVMSFADCSYAFKGHNIIITSAAGGGKSWLASALGMAACRKCMSVRFLAYRDLADYLKALRDDPRAHKSFAGSISRVDLLVIDDWLLGQSDEGDYDELFTVIDRRSRGRKSTILCSQYEVEGWPTLMGGYPCVESIVDRSRTTPTG
jgi:DNA replication protein DnaC